MRYGAICRDCPGIDKCTDKPTPANPISDDCPACGGAIGGCDECGGTGVWTITDCPLRILDEPVLMLARYADLFKKGLPPVAGGTLDQAAVFVEASLFLWAEENMFKKKLGIFNG